MNAPRSLLVFCFCAAVLASAALIYGCGDDTNNLLPKPDSGAAAIFNVTGDAAATDGGPNGAPPPPTLGVQIDRVGRPAINTTANHTFDRDASAHLSAQDEYNENGDPTTWPKYVPEIAKNLGIYDGLDQTCGNQAFADGDAGDTNTQRYHALATLLADDRLWVDTSQTTCAQYLAVEVNAVKKTTNTDCGGRALAYDVIDTTLNAVGSTLAAPTLTDGIPKVTAKTNGTTFPYLAASP